MSCRFNMLFNHENFPFVELLNFCYQGLQTKRTWVVPIHSFFFHFLSLIIYYKYWPNLHH